MAAPAGPTLTPVPCVPSPELRACAHHPEKAFSGLTGLGPCAGLVRHYLVVALTFEARAWICDQHAGRTS